MAPTQRPTAPVEVPTLRRWRWAVTAITVLATVVITAAVSTACGRVSPAAGPPLHQLSQIPLPGDNSRFDYASLDSPGLSPGAFFPSSGALAKVERALHEYLGMLFSRLRGQL